ncbi:MAG: ATP-dependent Clp protease adaptor ClpS [Clostridia bacterium]|nr:ATP-dependent Clp protease adaptor ClpS [Clostridia bacterium]
MEVIEKDTKVLTPLEPLKSWNVIMNQNNAPFQFKASIISTFFNKGKQEAMDLARKVEEEGSAVLGSYPYSIASERVRSAEHEANPYGYFLKFEIKQS